MNKYDIYIYISSNIIYISRYHVDLLLYVCTRSHTHTHTHTRKLSCIISSTVVVIHAHTHTHAHTHAHTVITSAIVCSRRAGNCVRYRCERRRMNGR